MNMRTEGTRERIVIDFQLGYPLVFVDYYGYDRCYEPFFAQAKREMLDNIGSGNGPVDWDKETATVKEALVIGRWMEKGYLCYPAPKYLTDETYGCGPKCVNIYGIISAFDGLRAIRWQNSCKSRRMEVSDFLHKAQKSGKLPQKDEQEERSSKDEPEERPAIVVTKELGYPMVFVEYAERGNCSDYFFAQVKETMFTNPFMPSEEVYKKNQSAIDAETRLIAGWLDKGYLCYPANGISLVDGEQCDCGPRYIADIRTIVRRANGAAGISSFCGYCRDIYEDVLANLCPSSSGAVETAKPAEKTLEEAINELDNLKVSCREGRVYYQAYPAGTAYDQMVNLWIRKSGLSDDEIYTLVGRPLASNLVLLTLPPEMKEYEDMYWAIIGSAIAPGDMRDIVNTQAALSKFLES